jgi:hypothetical protein
LQTSAAQVLGDETLQASGEKEMQAISTDAMRCSFNRSTIVFNRRERLSQAKVGSATRQMPPGTHRPLRPCAIA